MNGYIQLHRKLLDSAVFQNEKILKLFIYCLLKASYKDRDALIGDSIIKLNQGQFVTGRKALANDLKLSEQQVRTILKKLEKLNVIAVKSTNKYSVVSIVNWGLYQDSNQQANQQSTNNQPTANQQSTTNKKVNKVNKDNKGETKPKRFAPPSLEECCLFFNEKQSNDFEANKFFNYYESNDWKVGKNKMKKWESAASGWISRQGNFNSNQPIRKQGTLDDLDNYAENLLR